MTLFSSVALTTAFNARKYWKEDVIWDLEKLISLTGSDRVSHLVLARKKTATCMALEPIVDTNPDLFELIYENPSYRIVRIDTDTYSSLLSSALPDDTRHN